MKLLKKIGIILVVFIAVLVVGKNLIAKGLIETGVKFVTGLDLKMKGIDLGIANGYVGIQEMKLFNPKGYEDKIMVDMPEIYVAYDLPAIMKGNIHLPELRINLEEFVIVKNRDGSMNLDAITGLAKAKEGEPKAKPAEKAEAPKIQLDSFKLHLGRVIYKDYSKAKPVTREFNIKLTEEYRNIKDPNALIGLIVMKIMMNTPIAALSNFEMGNLQNTVSDTLASSRKIAEGAVTAASATLADVSKGTVSLVKDAPGNLKQTSELLGEASKDLTGEVQNTVSGIKEKLKLFGSKEE